MISRRFLIVISLLTTATSFFLLGVFHTQKQDRLERATYEARLDALRAEMRAQVEKATGGDLLAEGTSGVTHQKTGSPAVRKERPLTPRDRMIADIKRELQDEMGLLPVQLLRDRRSSFVELYSTDNLGKTSYGTAGYLGSGYFITVKHAVVALKDEGDRQNTRRVVSIRVSYQNKDIPARLIDAGDADIEVHSGDWAIIRTAKDIDLPPLNLDTSFAYDFADPIFRLGNDYSKGIILSTGYIGQRTANGLVTCLTDGHPGVSGGGVLNQRGDLVGIPIGRMQGDYRFSFILPVREEMLRKVQIPDESEGQIASAAQ
jgi:hypothetical protein